MVVAITIAPLHQSCNTILEAENNNCDVTDCV